MKFPLKYIIGGVVLIAALIYVAVQQVQISRLHRQIDNAQEKALQKKVDSVRTVTDTVEVKMAGDIKTVTKTITRVRVDTFIVNPATPADTAHSIVQLGTLVKEHADLQKKCTDLTISCDAFRVAVKNERKVTDDQIAGLKRMVAEKRKRDWIGAPDLVMGGGACATQTGVSGCLFVGLGGRLGW